MKKKYYVMIGLVVICALILVIAAAPSVRKHMKEAPAVPQQQATANVHAEGTTGLDDCTSFCTNHKSSGPEKDKAEFRKQFVAVPGTQGDVAEFGYDQDTKITLDCSAKTSCSCKCASRK